ncbi:MAG TPA: transaldolase [Candidatus Dormibacteraeota bacterium]|nr:transaldolase [Candidatus Dormibacteraeota bacterium]
MTVADLKVKLFVDGADLAAMIGFAANPLIKGFTTNPTLMRNAAVGDYEAFAKSVLERITDLPISFEVFADDADGMDRQARLIAGWGDNVYVKVPVTNTAGEATTETVRRLAADGVKVNVTAVLLPEQVREVSAALAGGAPAFISVFAGRIADTGRDPLPVICESLAIMARYPSQELIWASPRELLNVVQADDVGCHVITVTAELMRKLELLGRDLAEYSLATVRMFHDDAAAAGYDL